MDKLELARIEHQNNKALRMGVPVGSDIQKLLDEIERLEKQTVFWRNIADNSGDASLARAKEIERLQRENAELRGLATDEARRNESLRDEIEDLEAKLAAAEAAAMAYQQLSMCYRIGKRPTEKLFKQLENANKVCAAIEAARGDKGE